MFSAFGAPVSFTYDWAGNLTQEGDNESGAIAYSRSPAGEVNSITNLTYLGTGDPAALVSHVLNGPFGPVSYTLGNRVHAATSAGTFEYAFDYAGRRVSTWQNPSAGNRGNVKSTSWGTSTQKKPVACMAPRRLSY